MKQWKKVVAIVLVVILAFCYAHVAKSDLIYDKQVDGSEYIAVGLEKGLFTQEFVCKQKELDAVSIKCQVSGNVENSMIHMTLMESDSKEIVAVSKLSGNEIKSGKFNSFPFEKIENCKDKNYQLTLECSGSENGSIGVYLQDENESTLIMKTVANGFDMETFVVLLVMLLYIGVFFKFLCKLFSR